MPIRPAINWAARCCFEASSASAHADSLCKLTQLCVRGDASRRTRSPTYWRKERPTLQTAQLAMQSKLLREEEATEDAIS